MKPLRFTLIFAAILLVSCGKFGLYSGDNSAVLATVGDVELRAAELDHIYSGVITTEDSVSVRQAYVNSWVRNEVKRQAAEKAIEQQGGSAAKIDNMVKQYRMQLITYKFENDFIASHVDTTITEEQIDTYYKANSDNFRLAGPLVKAVVVRLPSGLRQSKRLEDMFKKPNGDSKDEFLNICQKNNYRVDDFSSEWTDFSIVLQHIPFGQSNFDEFLKTKSYYEVADDDYKYMMRIEGYLPSGSLSPKQREKDNITKILHNLRRAELLKSLDDSLLNVAKSEKLITIL